MKKILIFSAGSAGREVYQLIKEINKKKKTWKVLGYVDDNIKLKVKTLDKLKSVFKQRKTNWKKFIRNNWYHESKFKRKNLFKRNINTQI